MKKAAVPVEKYKEAMQLPLQDNVAHVEVL